MTDEDGRDDEVGSEEAMQELVRFYAERGPDALREMLRGHMPDAVIEAFLQQLADDATALQPQETLPAETVNLMAGNTYAVITNAPDQLEEWRPQLQKLRAEFAASGDDWAIEIAFADALLALLDNKPALLPDDNPYAPVLQQVKEAIKNYRAGEDDPGPDDEEDDDEADAQESLRMLAQLYAERGPDALREMLTGQMPDALIDKLLERLAAESEKPAAPRISEGAMQHLLGNTFAVSTEMPEKLDEWQAQLKSLVEQAGQHNDHHAQTLFAALLAVTEGRAASLMPDNPYAPVLQQLIATLAKYRADQGGADNT